MGGDDLASDDEYLFDSGKDQSSKAISSSDDDASFATEEVAPSATKKRKASGSAKVNDPSTVPSSKKRSKSKSNASPTSKSNLMIHAGRGIALDGPDAQATFLATCYSHAVKMSSGGDVSQGKQLDDIEESEIKEKKPKNPKHFVFQPHHFCTSAKTDDVEKQHSNLSIYLRQSNVIPSMKRLKNWKHNHSPMIIIISLSARRCVELQKQLAFLKLPVAKLFAKHMSVDDQVEMLKGGNCGKSGDGGAKKKGRCYGIGVGTPGRLLTLLRHGNEGLRLNHTEVVIIDCHEDAKGFNVVTLKDTAKELMDFMKEGVVGELEARKDKIKVALF